MRLIKGEVNLVWTNASDSSGKYIKTKILIAAE